ncbi:MAG: efflux RND transporter periplasmic adaptor subunit, partial [Acidobacteria bacterium]
MRRMDLVTLGMALLLNGCSKNKENEAEPVVPVQVVEVRQESIQRRITGDGILRARDQSAITPKISAPVRVFYVNRGDHVRKGQLLAVLENRDLAASLADSKGAFEQAAALYRNVAAAAVPDELAKAQQDVEAARQA